MASKESREESDNEVSLEENVETAVEVDMNGDVPDIVLPEGGRRPCLGLHEDRIDPDDSEFYCDCDEGADDQVEEERRAREFAFLDDLPMFDSPVHWSEAELDSESDDGPGDESGDEPGDELGDESDAESAVGSGDEPD